MKEIITHSLLNRWIDEIAASVGLGEKDIRVIVPFGLTEQYATIIAKTLYFAQDVLIVTDKNPRRYKNIQYLTSRGISGIRGRTFDVIIFATLLNDKQMSIVRVCNIRSILRLTINMLVIIDNHVTISAHKKG